LAPETEDVALVPECTLCPPVQSREVERFAERQEHRPAREGHSATVCLRLGRVPELLFSILGHSPVEAGYQADDLLLLGKRNGPVRDLAEVEDLVATTARRRDSDPNRRLQRIVELAHLLEPLVEDSDAIRHLE